MPLTRPIGIGVIGCGTIAYWSHLRSLKGLRHVRIAGLADTNPAALSRASELAHAPGFPTVDGLLANSAVDAVIVASPTPLHAGHVRAAIAAGKHIYLEKPVAHDAVSLSIFQTLVKDTGLALAVGYNLRFHPACQRLRQRLRSGSIGKIHAVMSHFAEPVEPANMPAWKRTRVHGGGVLLDLGSHHMDLYRWLLQEELLHFSTDTRSQYYEQDSAHVRASTPGGIELCGYFSFTSSRTHRMTIHGSTGVLHLDLHSSSILEERNRRFGYGVRRRRVSMGVSALAWQARKRIRPSYDPSHRLTLHAFIDVIARPGQRHADLATAGDGIAAVQAILDAEAAVAPGARVPSNTADAG